MSKISFGHIVDINYKSFVFVNVSKRYSIFASSWFI